MAGAQLGNWPVVLDWSICSDSGREEQEDVKGLLGTKPTDLGYRSCAESQHLCDSDYQALIMPSASSV